jgi:hypothetical protein
VVGADWAERQEPNNILIPASPAEKAIADELADRWLFPASGHSPYSGGTSSLFPWTLAKAFLSSPAALRETVRERRRRLGNDPAAAREAAALDRLEALVNDADRQRSAKYERLVQHLRQIGIGSGSDARAVVFAERVATLTWLQQNLPKDLNLAADAVEIMHGGLPDDEQQRVVEDFKQQNAPVRVLVTGDVASEGVNLHRQCHELIHYDIPWSLIRIEQRNGRIDRYGQKYPPRVTALLLEPDHARFRGDLRVLARLMERENEAHRALGDVASVMGKHDVKAEEDEIRAVLAGGKQLDDVVRSVDEVAASDDLEGLFYRLFDESDSPSTGPGAPDVETAEARSSGLYADDAEFLEDALHAAFIDPAATAARGGVGWRKDANFGIVELVPPPDLAQRLDVLPQSYLADRKVTDRLVLATTKARGQDRLAAALADDKLTSWPDAHYLGPLHPVLDWAADRALASLNRNEVFAVRGAVEHPTFLLLGTLTNTRGHVVAATWSTVAFPHPQRPDAAMLTPYGSARDALAAIGWHTAHANADPLADVDVLQRLVAPAIRNAAGQLDFAMSAGRDAVAARVRRWSERLARWDEDADALIQRRELRETRSSVRQEHELVRAMNPDRSLVRPLLAVVPQDWGPR